ncbi:TerB N-terminal domain-containing protein [Pantoea cypripedii]|uniref:ATPase n=1 Tax=Pantoea cypripedii TaxID=55209 RepID=A0A6B9G9Q6_PANCY|nr:TerB N-terminal domain-containing protein [Pantoea cypripedii]QGY33222.1 ATPase [Pantoea cypripedii]
MGFWIPFLIFLAVCFIFKKKKVSTSTSSHVSKSGPLARQNRAGRGGSAQTHAATRVDDDDDLPIFELKNGGVASFSIDIKAPSQRHQSNTAPARWVLPGESISIAGIEIVRGNVYFGGRLKPGGFDDNGFYDDGSESSLLNDHLSIVPSAYQFTDETLGYWPSFARLSAQGRGAYLSWLASERNDVTCPIGYVFIYFYGIERRVLVDAQGEMVADTEFKALFDEVNRLRSIFYDNRSFRHYSSQLLEAMTLMRGELNLLQENEEVSATGDSPLFRFHLAKTVAQGHPLPAALALSWVRNYPEYSMRTPARRCADEFASLFSKRYADKFGEGLTVKPNKTRLKLEIRPANATLFGTHVATPDLPDPFVLKGPIQKLAALADTCTDELDAYSRYLGRKNASRSDVAAIMLLPAEIINESTEQVFTRFRNWANHQIQTCQGLVSVSEFWTYMGMPIPAKINKKEAELMQDFARRTGYGMVPDLRYHHVKPEADGKVVLFAEGYGNAFNPGPEYISVSLALRLGAMVANTDNNIDISERDTLEKVIDTNPALTETEMRSLHAYLTWRLSTPSSMMGMKARIEQLGDTDKAAISQVIINVACADGKIAPAEIKQLEKIYSSLGLDSTTVASDIHKRTTSDSIQKTQPSKTVKESPVFTLDAGILARHESDTRDVRQLLSTIFIDDEPEEIPAASQIQSNSKTALDTAHFQLYQRLLEKDQWARDDVGELCKQLNLMLSGAIEVINDWSFEMVDAPVIEDSDDIWVDHEIAKEIEG